MISPPRRPPHAVGPPRRLVVLAVVLLLAGACRGAPPAADPPAPGDGSPAEVAPPAAGEDTTEVAAGAGPDAPPSGGPARLRIEVVSTRPHDPAAFTQGLVLHDGVLYESAGLYAQSSLRAVDPVTGEVLRRVEVPPEYFAEGLALTGDRLIQLTWRERVARVYDRATFELVGEHAYDTEGWGLCHDGRRLVMSDGSSTLYFRDPATFDVTGTVDVTLAGTPLMQLNELECVDGDVWSNVWQTDTIARIDPGTGVVTAVVDAAGLLTPAEATAADVLNGIAWDPAAGTFLITGKLWPTLFEVRFVE